jgi:F-type H+-transporting ATPase subunit gamma
MEELERAQTRLDHIRTVAPILSALRTISLGSWKAALKQSTNVRRYGERLGAILPLLVPHLAASRRVKLPARRARREAGPASNRIVVLVVGSERGLCGRFNAAAVERAERYVAEQEAAGIQVELAALGSRAIRILQRRGRPLAWSGALSVTTLPPYRTALDLTRRWLERYEAHDLDAVDLVHNAYHGTGRYEPTVTRLIPPPLHPQEPGSPGEPWPPPIIETDPLSLYARVVEQQTVLNLYGLLLDSAAAEHSTRFQLMEAATQNADQLIAELTLVVQTARQAEITQEMQELASGAGLIGPQGKGVKREM